MPLEEELVCLMVNKIPDRDNLRKRVAFGSQFCNVQIKKKKLKNLSSMYLDTTMGQ